VFNPKDGKTRTRADADVLITWSRFRAAGYKETGDADSNSWRMSPHLFYRLKGNIANTYLTRLNSETNTLWSAGLGAHNNK